MSRCPVCQTVRIVIVISPERRAFCTKCGARWIQEGGVQRSVRRPLAALTPSSTHEPEPKQA
jgi:uncharacterized paraquat-inducible protein A